MGNRATFCGSTALQCSDKCVFISTSNAAEAALLTGRRVCDPTGAVFNETLEELNDIDRQLLLFASSSNLIAVRWLLGLGGSPFTRDRNGTTCLHAACRSGSPAVVETLIAYADSKRLDQNPVLAVDISGWTPLHIAAFMGRHEVVTILLKANAPIAQRNFAGHTPAELCSDTRTREVISMLGDHVKERKFGPGIAGEGEVSFPFGDEMMLSSLDAASAALVTSQDQLYMRYEPFFVPRAPLIQNHELSGPTAMTTLTEIGKAIFNRQPGRGLAFVVACGCTRDYPIDLVAFLRGSNLDPGQVGSFLGEAFSLSKILRLEFINSVAFNNTGVVSALTKAFVNFKVPADLRKIDRIMHSLSEVWWRQHDRKEGPHAVLRSEGRLSLVMPEENPQESGDELHGANLRKFLPNPMALHQLLFSAMLLHWNLHAPLPDSQRLTLREWLDLNRGIAGAVGDLPEQVLVPIYRLLHDHEDMCLQIDPPESQAKIFPPGTSALSEYAQIEGWIRVLGSQVRVPKGLSGTHGDSSVTCVQMSNMLSEATDTARRQRDICQQPLTPTPRQSLSIPGTAGVTNLASVHAPSAPPRGMDAAWLSLCSSMLFFSVGPGDGAPFAFVHLRSVRLVGLEPGKSLITIDGGNAGFSLSKPIPLQMVFLLPDGRWQSFDIPQLEIEICDRSLLESWMQHFNELCKAPSTPAGEEETKFTSF